MKYNINNSKISKDIKMCYISDIHSDIDKLKSIFNNINDIDILLIGGDLLNSAKDYEEKEIIKDMLNELAKKVKIYIGLGNHELIYYKKINHVQRELKIDDSKYWKELGDIVNVSSFPNNNATFNKWSLKDIDISALNLPIEYYWDNEKKESLKKYIKLLGKVDHKKYNILLLHTPINIIDKKSISKEFEVLKEYDLILCGHMHSGLVPKIFRKKFGRGLVAPYKKIFPKYSYGLVKDENTTILISGGISKFSKTTKKKKKIRNFFYKIYPEEIEIFNVKRI